MTTPESDMFRSHKQSDDLPTVAATIDPRSICRHASRFFGWSCVGAAATTPFITTPLWGLKIASEVAVLASLPIAVAALIAVYLSSEKAPKSSNSQPILRYGGIGFGCIISTISALMIFLVSSPRDSGESLVSQPLTILDGLKPSTFDGGKTWKWLELKPGTTIVLLSPGSGPRNDNLRKTGGIIYPTGSCTNYIHWSLKADGQPLVKDYGSTFELPDHVDLLTLEIAVDPLPDECTVGLSWNNPSVFRSNRT